MNYKYFFNYPSLAESETLIELYSVASPLHRGWAGGGKVERYLLGGLRDKVPQKLKHFH